MLCYKNAEMSLISKSLIELMKVDGYLMLRSCEIVCLVRDHLGPPVEIDATLARF